MSLVRKWKLKQGLLTLAVASAGVLLITPAVQARVGVGVNLNFPPAVIAPPPVVAAPPPVVVAPAGPPAVVAPGPYYAAPYYAAPYYYAPAPGFGFFWFDRFGHRHWRRH